MEGNTAYIRDTGLLASDVPTEIMFEFFEYHKNYSTANFTFTWDLGNGEVIHRTEPAVRYHYPQSGNYTLCLKIGVNMTKYAPPFAGIYSTNVQVLDAIKQMNLKDPSYYEVSKNSTLAFNVDGSPPMWVCWRFLPNCVADVSGGCTLTMLYENTLRLNHTFTNDGVHCLDVSLRNDISKLQSSFSLYVKGNSNTHVVYILSSAAVLVATLSFITAIAWRRCHRSRSQIAASSNGMFLGRRDTEPLLLQYGTQYPS
ncbi:Transmembrane protein 130 Precursor [Channa argus]|uniref:Transmembrane protein 130 n=2 Tax=Channa argus TaxID=215402 RepID=A0A6G1QPK6_CHAAH|nr:Transmembrane protein 130 Precursor [Channa argus]